MPVQDLWDLNEFLKQFKAHEAYAKGKNDENKAIKKFRDYCDYFDAVVNLNKRVLSLISSFDSRTKQAQ